MDLECRSIKSEVQYKMTRKLGEGRDGEVFLAIRKDRPSGLQQFVAIKFLGSESQTLDWEFEFEGLSRVRSENCAHCYGFDRLNGRPSLVLEYIDGLSLYELSQIQSFEKPEILFIISQICLGLGDLHGSGLVHGDLNPKNIMIDRLGRVKLIDYGLNRHNKAQRMTLQFCAPEMVNEGLLNEASDIYSLGCLYQWLCERCGLQADLDILAQMLDVVPHKRRMPMIAVDSTMSQVVAHHVKRQMTENANRVGTEGVATGFSSRWLMNVKLVTLPLVISLIAGCIDVTARRSFGWLTVISATRWAEVWMSGDKLGYTPLVNVPMTVGEHRIELRWKDKSESYVVQVKSMTTSKLTVKPKVIEFASF